MILEFREGLMKPQERRWSQGDRNPRYARWPTAGQAEARKQTIRGREFRGSLVEALHSQ